ncbi:MAG: class I SAM-dependent methyltransferase [Proteobacteria bacterium]|nr:class I SAM-dependent methyltransferase [Pseudomonadota bacterium]MBI3499641.1 class I SAM-dependent methyltransferase [Pseudomonadota bacterium]
MADHAAIRRLYGWGSAVYDLVFGSVLEPGRLLAVDAVNLSRAARVLEIGVGTGLSLPHYRAGLMVTGIDLSPEMLTKARARAATLGTVEALLEMDAQNLTFPDASFDAVVAMYVVAVVPDMRRLFHELKRVTRPDGDVYVVNHIRAETGILGLVDRLAQPLTRRLAVRSDLTLSHLEEVAGIERVQVSDANLGGYLKLVHFRNRACPR